MPSRPWALRYKPVTAHRHRGGLPQRTRDTGEPSRIPACRVTNCTWSPNVNADQGYDSTLWAFDASMDRLDPDYLDLYLIHWPMPQENKFADTFKAFAHLRDQGLDRPIATGGDKTPAQVLIRWRMQLGNIVIPKSVNPKRIASNFDVFDFKLSAEEMASISSLDDETRLGLNPHSFNFAGR